MLMRRSTVLSFPFRKCSLVVPSCKFITAIALILIPLGCAP